MLGIADDYERLAQRAQERAAGRPQPRQLFDPEIARELAGLHQARRALLGIVRQVDVKGGPSPIQLTRRSGLSSAV
jgi:hypothetical protein